MRKILLLTFVLILYSAGLAQSDVNINKDPRKVKFVTTDIPNFWRAYDLASKEADRSRKVEIFQREYLDKGSPGLQDFLRLRIKDADTIVKTIDRYPKYYASIRQPTLQIEKMRPALEKSFRRLKEMYPDAVFPDVYFLIGVANSGGTTGKSGLLIGSEMYGLNDATNKDELSPWLRTVINKIEYIPAIVSHESCHYNQVLPPQRTLLEKSIQEGSCDLIGELMSGGNINEHLKVYGKTHDPEIWAAFQGEMNSPGWANWLYNGSSAKDKPADLGYYVGYRISEAYYKNAKEKKQAVHDILNIKDFAAFLAASKYNGQ